ncbi:choice-of-anchor D domain-containing protein [bacterium]|nr:choice-of-anchor D domain-containing protein [bacterium]
MAIYLSIRRTCRLPRPGPVRRTAITTFLTVLLAGMAASTASHAIPSVPVEAGYRDANYGSTVYGRVTEAKPEAKLWYQDGSWWGVLWDDAEGAHRIHEFDLTAQSWTSVGPNDESNPRTLVDCLWDESTATVYVTSHETDRSFPSYLRAYTYDSFTRTYSALPGFPVQVANKGSEALTIAKDSTGKLWVTWERNGIIWVNSSQTSDTDWGTPFQLPVQGSLCDEDDISAVATLNGEIGIMWSDQITDTFFLAVHQDGDADSVWAPREAAMDAEVHLADDHINLAVGADGTLYAAVKTDFEGPMDPIELLLVRDPSGDWTNYTVAYRYENLTRPIVVLDEESELVHVFSADTEEGTIRWHMSDSADIDFTVGTNRIFVQSALDPEINNPTSTKQNVDSITGLLLAASDNTTNHYFHNYWVPLSIPMDYGWRDSYYGELTMNDPTAQKPESKLWWHDGDWWGCLWDNTQGSHRIQRFDPEENAWMSDGPDVDARPETAVDCLWDGANLYVASHGVTDPADEAYLFSYTYDALARTWVARTGFPALITTNRCEALTIAKDTTGKLWASWEAGRRIYVNCTLGSDDVWGTPFWIPTMPNKTLDDDLCAIAAFDGKVGVLYSDQSDEAFYFSYHVDGNPDATWSPMEIAYQDATLGPVADDHINLSVGSDGTLYAAVKTDLSGSTDPEVCALRRAPSGTWDMHEVCKRSDGGTRPIMLIDEGLRRMYVMYTSNKFGYDAIHYKESDLDEISFVPGPGDLFMRSRKYRDINNATSTKQNVNSTMGILVQASNADTHHFTHAYLPLAAPLFGPDIAVGPTPCDWGPVDVGTQAFRDITVRNMGVADLHVSTIMFTGPDTDYFSFTSPVGPFTLAPGDSLVAQVSFAPLTGGQMTAAIQLTSDDPDENPKTLILLGMGLTATTGVGPNLMSGPAFHLAPPRQNPARGFAGSSFHFTLPQSDRVTVSLYDVAGRLVARRPEERFLSGAHTFQWNPGPLPSGTYFVRLTTGSGEARTTRWVHLR